MDEVNFLLVFCLLVLGLFDKTYQEEKYDYCDPKLNLCSPASDHVMCKYPNAGPAPQCSSSPQPLTHAEKQKILYFHNKCRSNVAIGADKVLPSAANMMEMSWDEELETLAQRWADQCVSASNGTINDKCRNIKRFSVAQNVGSRRVNGTIIDRLAPQIVNAWCRENRDFDPALVDKLTLPKDSTKFPVKQLFNMLRGGTFATGCARVIFQEKSRNAKHTLTTERLICNYGPAGSENGEPLYKRGEPCSDCPDGTICGSQFTGLCVPFLGRNLPIQPRKDPPVKTTDSPVGKSDHEIVNYKSPKVTKYLVRQGVMVRGTCHCSQINRSYGVAIHSSIYFILFFCLLFGYRVTDCMFSA